MDSHTSVMAAIFLVLMSPFRIGAGDVIWVTRDHLSAVGAALHPGEFCLNRGLELQRLIKSAAVLKCRGWNFLIKGTDLLIKLG